jgi:hypothetical protein
MSVEKGMFNSLCLKRVLMLSVLYVTKAINLIFNYILKLEFKFKIQTLILLIYMLAVCL